MICTITICTTAHTTQTFQLLFQTIQSEKKRSKRCRNQEAEKHQSADNEWEKHCGYSSWSNSAALRKELVLSGYLHVLFLLDFIRECNDKKWIIVFIKVISAPLVPVWVIYSIWGGGLGMEVDPAAHFFLDVDTWLLLYLARCREIPVWVSWKTLCPLGNKNDHARFSVASYTLVHFRECDFRETGTGFLKLFWKRRREEWVCLVNGRAAKQRWEVTKQKFCSEELTLYFSLSFFTPISTLSILCISKTSWYCCCSKILTIIKLHQGAPTFKHLDRQNDKLKLN